MARSLFRLLTAGYILRVIHCSCLDPFDDELAAVDEPQAYVSMVQSSLRQRPHRLSVAEGVSLAEGGRADARSAWARHLKAFAAFLPAEGRLHRAHLAQVLATGLSAAREAPREARGAFERGDVWLPPSVDDGLAGVVVGKDADLGPRGVIATVIVVAFAVLAAGAWNFQALCGHGKASGNCLEDLPDEGLCRRLLSLPEKGSIPSLIQALLAANAVLFVFLVVLVVLLVDTQTLRTYWFVPILGFAGCMVPSAGVPMAGGVIFFPIMSISGLSPDACVAFMVAIQTVSVGIFVPLAWSVRDPSVIVRPALPYVVPTALAGLIVGTLGTPIHGDAITWLFTCFIIFIAVYTGHGLMHDMEHQDEKLAIERPSVKFNLMFAGLMGGFFVAWIGVGVEKTIFWALTVYGVDPTKAAITGVTIAGLLSFVYSVYDAFSGNFPLDLWLLGLPGLLLGSTFGIYLHSALGPKLVLAAFMCLLVFDAVRNLIVLL